MRRSSTSTGLAWLSLQTVGGKVVNFLTQIILAWLLSRSDFGLVAETFAITTLAALICQAGVSEVLIRRHRRFDRWSNAGWWVSMSFGLLAVIIMLVAAPIAAWQFNSPALLGMIPIVALGTLIESAGRVGRAKLQQQMYFRAIAGIDISYTLVMAGLSILFASLGFGPYSFVLPIPVARLIQSTGYLAWGRPRIGPNPQWSMWRFLVAKSGIVFLGTLFYAAMGQGDYLAMAAMHLPKIQIGEYFFAFNISMQTIMLLTINLSAVILPTLSRHKNQPDRQLVTYLKASELLAIIGIPLCLVQAAVAGPIFYLMFQPRWYSAVFMIQALSIGMAMRVVSWPNASLILAQGRYYTRLAMAIGSAAIFFLLVVIGGLYSKADGVAIAVMVYSLVVGPVNIAIAIRPNGGRWHDVLQIYRSPWLLSLATIGVTGVPAGYLFEVEQWYLSIPMVGLGVLGYAIGGWFVFATQRDDLLRLAVKLGSKIVGYHRLPRDLRWANPPARPDFRPIFIVGYPRSGTTLLATLLDRNSRLAIPAETHFFNTALPQVIADRSLRTPEQSIDTLLSDTRMRDLGITADQLRAQLPAGEVDMAKIFQAALMAVAESQGKDRVGEKTPNHLPHVDRILHWFANARIIWIVRDGRDAVQSIMQMPWSHDHLRLHCVQWTQYMRQGRRLQKHFHQQVRTVRFEQLLREPVATLQNLHDWLDLPFEPGQLLPQTHPGTIPKWESDWKAKAAGTLDAGRAEAWRREIPDPTLATMHSVMGRELRRMGYELPPTRQPIGRRCRQAVINFAYQIIFQREIHRVICWLKASLIPHVDLITDEGKDKDLSNPDTRD